MECYCCTMCGACGRKEKKTAMLGHRLCPKCEKEAPDNEVRICPYCGAQLPPPFPKMPE